MRKLFGFVGMAAVLAAVAWLTPGEVTAEDDAPKYTIEEIMEKAHTKKGIYNKIIKGDGTKEEKKQLVELYVALGQNKPPKGDLKSWKEKTSAMLAAAKDLAAGKSGADAKLKKAADCMACHDVHKAD